MNTAHDLLIVDDNPADIALAREGLLACSYCGQINSVADGAEALEFLERQGKYAAATKPDLVLLDLNLPKKNGLAVLAEIKARPDLRRIPVVIFSTSRLSTDIGRAYELGANSYISKPGNLKEFFALMKSIEEFWFGSVCLPPRGEQQNHELTND